ncbi:MAG: hypothetical protein WCA07_03125 [Gloeobacterales cyanobacterium]
MALHSPFTPSKSPQPFWVLPTLALVTAATLAISGSGMYQMREQALVVNGAYQNTREVVTQYFKTVEAREQAIRQANPDQVARIDQSLAQNRKAFVKAMQGYIVAIADLPQKEMTERFGALDMEGAAHQSKIQARIHSFKGVGRLIHLQVSETPDEWNQRHLNFWLSEDKQPQVHILNDFAKDPDAMVEQLAFLNTPDTPKHLVLLAVGKKASLGGVSPWIEVFQVQQDHLENKTAQVFPQSLLNNVLGESPTIEPNNYIRLERYVLDPERVMAPCDSCGLLAYQSQLQWKQGRYQLVENTPLNTADNASYAGLLYLKKRAQTPTWTEPFLSNRFRTQAHELPAFQPKRYALWNQGFILEGETKDKDALTFSFTGVADTKLIVERNAQGQWQVQNMRTKRGNFWNAPVPAQ